MSFRTSRVRRARSASPTVNRRTSIRVRDYRNEDVAQRKGFFSNERERIQTDAPKTPVIAEKVTEQKETSEKSKSSEATADEMTCDSDATETQTASDGYQEAGQSLDGKEKSGTVDENPDDSLHDSGIDLGDDSNSQKSTSVVPMISSDEEDSGKDSCKDDEVCTATPENSQEQRAVESQEQNIVSEATAASGDAAPDLEPKPVTMSEKPEGKRKREALGSDKSDIRPAVRRCINKKYDGMPNTSKPNTSVEPGASASSPKPTVAVPVTSPLSKNGSNGKDEVGIQVTEQLDLQEQATVDVFSFRVLKWLLVISSRRDNNTA
jgi:hypothetical protein